MDRSKGRDEISYGIVTVFSVMVFLVLMSLLTGKGITDDNAYNTYALQADSWRQGRLDLGQNYPWLELAVYNGKYYCSFPPFPSYVLFPLTFLFGSHTPDFLLIWLLNAITAFFLYKLAVNMKLSPSAAMLQTFFVMMASNYVFTAIDPAVWFMAQTMCFMLAVMSIYYACQGKGALSLFFWAGSVGCRPMQILFLPVLIILLLQFIKRENPQISYSHAVVKHLKWGIPAGVVAVSYMLLNYLRFGNILEFGHNYLPEFTTSEYGQFHPIYMKDNIKMLFSFPEFTEDGRMVINSMGSLNMFIVSPAFLFALLILIYAFTKRAYTQLLMGIGIVILSMIYMLSVTMHKTMGGWHFGNRYSNDILPWAYLILCLITSRFPKLIKYQVPLCIWGLILNTVGTVCVYNGLV